MDRYSRQTKLTNINERGQELLLTSSVLIIGVGGLGCPVAQYLVGAGVGRVGLVDGDTVDLSNLHRQVLYTEEDCRSPKASAAMRHLKNLNSTVELEAFDSYLSEAMALELFDRFEIIIDCTDNIPARLLINDVCCKLDKAWVYGGVRQFEGQVSVFNHENGPSYKCLFPNHAVNQASCIDEGVLGTSPGIVGTYMANETIKLILGIGDLLSGKLMVINFLSNSTHIYVVKRNPENFVFGEFETIRTITPIELKNKFGKEDFLLIDVREANEVAICTLPDAIHLPLSTFSTSYEVIENETRRPIIAYCHHGMRSLQALQFLQSKGFQNLHNLSGGIDQWAKEIDPAMKRY
ncbi:HesA/MoeB/ThiF family protein [Parvicella tangerina]|uniref:Thiosulfate sulfurtransferase GlpE n=1 Tax=Parvicella tangerina TaxID=2829795 RepID=A0A916NEM7_9FLAO|nr:HesA/MoeB/ThiF family protein [Parvicella tangerina]CAG5087027.1 Thiosulfate sulfurtransferase GlpE [Parvicella tangerina]